VAQRFKVFLDILKLFEAGMVGSKCDIHL